MKCETEGCEKVAFHKLIRLISFNTEQYYQGNPKINEEHVFCNECIKKFEKKYTDDGFELMKIMDSFPIIRFSKEKTFRYLNGDGIRLTTTCLFGYELIL
jgi:hypothetical protein